MSACLDYTINETMKSWNESNQGTEEDERNLISALVGFLIGGTAFILNTLVFITLIVSKELRQNTHLNLVLCLSHSDLVLGLSMCVGGIRLFTPQWATYYVPCVMTSVLFISGITLSFCQTFLISFHRFLKISTTDLDKKLLQNNRKYVVYILFWLVVLGFNLSMVQIRHVAEKLPFCKFKCVFGNRYPIMAIYFQSTTISLLSLTILFYCLTICRMRQRYRRTFAWHAHQSTTVSNISNQVGTTSNSGGDQLTKKMNQKLFGSMKLIGIIIAALLLCTGPMVIASFFESLTQRQLFIVATLSCFNSVVNPFIYAFNMEKLRREWKAIWHMIKTF
ncbi:octopamine receptor beta-1R-like [Saccostrea echinata]|uniref:octopamine receptor beta-1R-like n=1 Tax=Saccostrea echinata TaxID=191078 RepID=UPI002A83668E|nr:octopamine receptor beta-1R-like [Saccostrea echinata]